jgi:hypothetical protein
MFNSQENILFYSYYTIKKDHEKLFYMYMNFDSLSQNYQNIILQFKSLGEKFFYQYKNQYQIESLPFRDDFIEESFFQLGLLFFRLERLKKLSFQDGEFIYIKNKYLFLENQAIQTIFLKIQEHFLLLNK